MAGLEIVPIQKQIRKQRRKRKVSYLLNRALRLFLSILTPVFFLFFAGLLTYLIYRASEWILVSSIRPEIKKAIVSPEVYSSFITLGGGYLTFIVQRRLQIQQRIDEARQKQAEEEEEFKKRRLDAYRQILSTFNELLFSFSKYIQSNDLEERLQFTKNLDSFVVNQISYNLPYLYPEHHELVFRFVGVLNKRTYLEPDTIIKELDQIIQDFGEVFRQTIKDLENPIHID